MSELLFDAILKAPLRTKTDSGASQWAGTTILGSGQTSVTVSTTLVKSSSLIFSQVQVTGVASNFGVNVRTIIDATSFTFSHADAAARPIDVNVFFMLINK